MIVEDPEFPTKSTSPLIPTCRSSSNVFRYQRPRSLSSLSIVSATQNADEADKKARTIPSGYSNFRYIPDKVFLNPDRYSWFCNESVLHVKIVKIPQPQWQVRTRPQTPSLTPSQSIASGLHAFPSALSMTQQSVTPESNTPVDKSDILNWKDVVIHDDFDWKGHLKSSFPFLYKIEFPKEIVLSSIPTWFKLQKGNVLLDQIEETETPQTLDAFEFWICASESGIYFGENQQTNDPMGVGFLQLDNPEVAQELQQVYQFDRLKEINVDCVTGVTIHGISFGLVLPLPNVLTNLKHIEVTCQNMTTITDLVVQCKSGVFPKLESIDINFLVARFNRTNTTPRSFEIVTLLQELSSTVSVNEVEDQQDEDGDVMLEDPDSAAEIHYTIPAINIRFFEQSKFKETVLDIDARTQPALSPPHIQNIRAPEVNTLINIEPLQSLRFDNLLHLNSHVNTIGLQGMPNLTVLEIGLENFSNVDENHDAFPRLEMLTLHLNLHNTPTSEAAYRLDSFCKQEFTNLKKFIILGSGESWFYPVNKDFDIKKLDQIDPMELGVVMPQFLQGAWTKFIRKPIFTKQREQEIKEYIETQFPALIAEQTTSSMFKDWNTDKKQKYALELLTQLVQRPGHDSGSCMSPFTFTFFNFDFAICYAWEVIFQLIGTKMKNLEFLSFVASLSVYSSPRLKELLLREPENEIEDPNETAVNAFGCPRLLQVFITTLLQCNAEIDIAEKANVDLDPSYNTYLEWYLRKEDEVPKKNEISSSRGEESRYALYSVWDVDAKRYERAPEVSAKTMVKISKDPEFKNRAFRKERGKPFDFEYMYGPDFKGWI